jgi:hypothetical protein
MCSPSFLPSEQLISISEEQTMEETMEQLVAEDIEFERTDEEVLVHEWRAEQLVRVGISRVVAEGFAGRVDWHDIAALVERGCSPDLALDIVR